MKYKRTISSIIIEIGDHQMYFYYDDDDDKKIVVLLDIFLFGFIY